MVDKMEKVLEEADREKLELDEHVRERREEICCLWREKE